MLLSLFCFNAADRTEAAPMNKNTFKLCLKFEDKIKYLFQNRNHVFTNSIEDNSTIVTGKLVTARVLC